VLSEDEVKLLIGAARTPRERAILELGYASGLRVAELAKLRIEDVNLKARSLIVIEGKWGNDRVGLFGRPAAAALREYIGDRATGYLFVQQSGRQRGGLWRDRHYGIWFGQWRENDKTGKRVMRTVRLGDYELPTRERARQVLDTYLARKLPHEKTPKGRGRLNTRTLYRIIVQAAKRAGLSGVHPHTLRHSMATHCLNHGMDIRHVQELLGHTGLGVTQKYLHLATEDLQRVHAKFSPRG
jgi:site-specific recombinase XerD